MAISELNEVERQLLAMIGRGHRERRLQVFYRGEIYCTAPFTWVEISVQIRAADDVIADAVAALVAAGAVDSVRQPSRLFRWIRRTKPATFFFITQKGKRWLAQIDQAMALEQSRN